MKTKILSIPDRNCMFTVANRKYQRDVLLVVVGTMPRHDGTYFDNHVFQEVKGKEGSDLILHPERIRVSRRNKLIGFDEFETAKINNEIKCYEDFLSLVEAKKTARENERKEYQERLAAERVKHEEFIDKLWKASAETGWNKRHNEYVSIGGNSFERHIFAIQTLCNCNEWRLLDAEVTVTVSEKVVCESFQFGELSNIYVAFVSIIGFHYNTEFNGSEGIYPFSFGSKYEFKDKPTVEDIRKMCAEAINHIRH